MSNKKSSQKTSNRLFSALFGSKDNKKSDSILFMVLAIGPAILGANQLWVWHTTDTNNYLKLSMGISSIILSIFCGYLSYSKSK